MTLFLCISIHNSNNLQGNSFWIGSLKSMLIQQQKAQSAESILKFILVASVWLIKVIKTCYFPCFHVMQASYDIYDCNFVHHTIIEERDKCFISMLLCILCICVLYKFSHELQVPVLTCAIWC